jgi:hypothetical protein
MENNQTPKTPAEKLRAELSALGASAEGLASDNYLRQTAPEQVIVDVRAAISKGAQPSPSLEAMLRLNDDTLALAIVGLRDAGTATAGDESSPASLSVALAESYLENYNMKVLLDGTVEQLRRMLKRAERGGAVLESDAICRDALAVIGAVNLWKEDRDNPLVAGLLEELAARVRLETTTAPPDDAAADAAAAT